jgi:predicted nucleotide-binding protein
MGATKVLLADKDQELRQRWANLLRTHGFVVQEVTSFSEAREICRKRPPDLAVIDLHLSEGEGHSPLLAGRAIDYSVQTIITVACPTMDVVREAFRRKTGSPPPAVDVIGKDEGDEAVLAAVRRALTPRVFVAHGHDLGAKDELVRFLMALELRPVVLNEEAETGRTIIEKFEDYSDVAYAIILLTPDDVGGTATAADLRPRARQNVIFELGYFFGKLGRDKVAALCKRDDGELELPSDYSSILSIKMDPAGGWKIKLAKEMITAHFDIDLDRVFQS